jgi:hypothetical protein
MAQSDAAINGEGELKQRQTEQKRGMGDGEWVKTPFTISCSLFTIGWSRVIKESGAKGE